MYLQTTVLIAMRWRKCWPMLLVIPSVIQGNMGICVVYIFENRTFVCMPYFAQSFSAYGTSFACLHYVPCLNSNVHLILLPAHSVNQSYPLHCVFRFFPASWLGYDGGVFSIICAPSYILEAYKFSHRFITYSIWFTWVQPQSLRIMCIPTFCMVHTCCSYYTASQISFSVPSVDNTNYRYACSDVPRKFPRWRCLLLMILVQII